MSSRTRPLTPDEIVQVQRAKAYAKTYWARGNEPVSQEKFMVLLYYIEHLEQALINARVDTAAYFGLDLPHE